jgi:hypothetical protein
MAVAEAELLSTQGGSQFASCESSIKHLGSIDDKTHTASYVKQRTQFRTQDSINDRIPWKSKHPVLTGHTYLAPLVEIRYGRLPVVKTSMEITAKQRV